MDEATCGNQSEVEGFAFEFYHRFGSTDPRSRRGQWRLLKARRGGARCALHTVAGPSFVGCHMLSARTCGADESSKNRTPGLI